MSRHNTSTEWSRRRFLSAGLLAAGSLLVPSVTLRAEKHSASLTLRRSLWAMGGWNYLQVECATREVGEAAITAMIETIRGIDRTFSVFDSRSPISRLNQDHRRSVPIDDPLLLESIGASLRWSRRLDGAFDPTVEPLMKYWGFREGVALPNEISPELPMRDWGYRMVECDMARARIDRESPLIRLDSGGWAKGLCSERAARAAIGRGATSAQISCGGDIYRLSANATWQCDIRNPLGGRSDHALRVRQQFRSVATSGNMETYRVAPSGQHIGHLMDPRSGHPAVTDLLAVSVFGDDGLAVDAASSALFVMGKSRAVQWLSSNSEFAAVLIDDRWPTNPESVTIVGDLKAEYL